ncbi:MAG: hypothetical protein IJ179_10985 [Oscillospiraceae bacterium]|nr:hypothetical protein [Oscillospiraceae bacterium]MBQ9250874.1 hypothetical protein [Oscillospiraceae bacterium]
MPGRAEAFEDLDYESPNSCAILYFEKDYAPDVESESEAIRTLAAAEGACSVTAYDALSGLRPVEELMERIRAGWPTMKREEP